MSDSPKKKIRVLVVDDSDFQRGVIVGILETDPEIEIVGQAKNGEEAIEKTLQLQPDIITMDIKMPVMDGLEATREIMAERPTPILVVSVTICDEQKFAFTCLKQGALDFVPITSDAEIVAEELIAKVKMCSRIKVVTHPRGRRSAVGRVSSKKVGKYEVVAIAVSTGGPPALEQVLRALPERFPVPILIVQHISEGFTQSLAEWLNEQCKIKVVVAKDRDELKAATAYLAPDGRHLIIDESEKIKLLKEDFPTKYNKPSADIMLKSLADIYGPRAVGVIMTGMGRDGALGIKAIKQAGGITIAQDEKTSVVFGMNKAAIDAGCVDKVVPLDKIADEIVNIVS